MESQPNRRLLGGILVQKPCWTLSWKGKFLALGVLAVTLIIFKFFIYSFLAPNHPLGGRFLVVEGWIPNYALNDAMAIFKRGGYEKILTSGGQAKGVYSIQYKVTYAALAAQYLKNECGGSEP